MPMFLIAVSSLPPYLGGISQSVHYSVLQLDYIHTLDSPIHLMAYVLHYYKHHNYNISKCLIIIYPAMNTQALCTSNHVHTNCACSFILCCTYIL